MYQGYKVIDADAHFYEPPDIWNKYVEKEFYDRRPIIKESYMKSRLVYEGDGVLIPKSKGEVSPSTVRRYRDQEKKYGDAWRDWWSPKSRLKDMDKFGWDGHDKSHEYHRRNGETTDRATAALLWDLKRRGLLEETLVVWGGEFGRTPMEQGGGGRNHNPYGFTVWLAGGGVRGGQSIGATDEIGLRSEVDPHPAKDLHATILTAMGLKPDDLYFETNGRQERLTGVAGSSKVIPGVL